MTQAKLEGRVALVTGGLRGIGRAIVEAFVAEGAITIITDLDDEASDEARAARGAMPRSIYQRLDVTSERDWERARQEIETAYGHLDILVNNAGGDLSAPVEAISVDNWRRVMSLNVESVFLGTKTFRTLLAKGGQSTLAGSSVINISSVLGLIGMSGNAAYCATKGAVRLFTKATALEFADAGLPIRVNSVHPGVIDTPLIRRGFELQAAATGLSVEDCRNGIHGITPMRRLGRPEEIGRVVAFLASDDASFMTGSELVADGGWSAR
jgi:NAD(P)-dependent dehydrogenase (short-subunit alcohol dehydrogenase family)